jgi:small nuclear ribonucleoprotein (snRNP)-like protein
VSRHLGLGKAIATPRGPSSTTTSSVTNDTGRTSRIKDALQFTYWTLEIFAYRPNTSHAQSRACSLLSAKMLFFSFFKTLVDHEITVELKNEVCIRGTLKSVDQYLNIKLDNAEATDEMRWPHLVRLARRPLRRAAGKDWTGD